MDARRHEFDLDPTPDSPLDLFVEELPEQVQLWSDCLATGTTFSSKGCLSSFSTFGSIISTGARLEEVLGTREINTDRGDE